MRWLVPGSVAEYSLLDDCSRALAIAGGRAGDDHEHQDQVQGLQADSGCVGTPWQVPGNIKEVAGMAKVWGGRGGGGGSGSGSGDAEEGGCIGFGCSHQADSRRATSRVLVASRT
eukprot:151974-Pleurochrysis_carterae.AAC.1